MVPVAGEAVVTQFLSAQTLEGGLGREADCAAVAMAHKANANVAIGENLSSSMDGQASSNVMYVTLCRRAHDSVNASCYALCHYGFFYSAMQRSTEARMRDSSIASVSVYTRLHTPTHLQRQMDKPAVDSYAEQA